MATHSNILAWEIPWTEEPSSASPWGRKECLLAGGPLFIPVGKDGI